MKANEKKLVESLSKFRKTLADILAEEKSPQGKLEAVTHEFRAAVAPQELEDVVGAEAALLVDELELVLEQARVAQADRERFLDRLNVIEGELREALYQKELINRNYEALARENSTLTEKGTDQGLIDTAVEFLRVSGHQRWFLYLHLMDLHEFTYDAESALFGSTHSDLYDNSIRWTDGSIGLLLEALAELGQLDKTIIAVVSDHGEAFLERGYEGHAREVYRETTEVPFLLSLPFRLDPGVVIATRTQNVDVWPTIFDLLGLAPPEEIDGRSRLPEILSSGSGKPPVDGARIAISDLDQHWAQRDSEPLPAIAIVEDGFRYVRMARPDAAPQLEQLFDAKDDPRELRNRAADESEKFEQLRAAADDYSRSKPPWGDAPTREIGELELNLLRALGYKVR